ncbi:MAG: 16S rRNA (cytidine(1402)-2'-O)-methyltransferase [Pseudomonadota bacterium]|nr:16S rRNA (cytidine(1402)-2'-O)-methyltransferase [Pseudomonadota bacterium]
MSNPRSPDAGCLYVVATPIGHRDDFSARAVDTLRKVSVIACEDTRHSAPLLNSIGAVGKRVALHDHNEAEACAGLVAQMRLGESIALISDAGTPLVSDPGFRLVQAAVKAGVRVVPIPGPSALVAALSVAGLATDRFSFEGFLPNKRAARRGVLDALAQDPRTLVFYEARHRILESLEDMVHVFGADREAVVARELTKTFETILRGALADVLQRIRDDSDQQLGEFVVIVSGAANLDVDARRLLEGRRILDLLKDELPPSRAVRLAAEISGAPKNALYKLIDE